MKTSVFLVASAGLIAGIGCSVAGGSPKTGLPDLSVALDSATEPIPVRLVADDSRSISQEVPVEGGTLTATGAGGTRFTLEVPPDALLQTTTITMTPLVSMDGIPFGEGDPLAVKLEPEGLHLFAFATLTITPASDIPLEEQIPVGTSGSDDSLEMPVAVLEDGVLAIKLLHFSSAGVTKGLLADMEPWRQRLGGDVERDSRARSPLSWRSGANGSCSESRRARPCRCSSSTRSCSNTASMSSGRGSTRRARAVPPAGSPCRASSRLSACSSS